MSAFTPALLDENSFEEWDMFIEHRYDFGMEQTRVPGDGVVANYEHNHGRQPLSTVKILLFLVVRCQRHCRKICKIMDQAIKTGIPLIGLNDSGGARIQGRRHHRGYAEVFQRNVLASDWCAGAWR